jgi:predicted RNA-binding Zn-ribbon protein involved in translation (DUF1610 family)
MESKTPSCPVCYAELPSKALRSERFDCPHCGAVLRRSHSRVYWCVRLFIVFAGAFACAWSYRLSNLFMIYFSVWVYFLVASWIWSAVEYVFALFFPPKELDVLSPRFPALRALIDPRWPTKFHA